MASKTKTSDPEENKAIALRLAEVFNGRRLHLLEDVLHPEFRERGLSAFPPAGSEAGPGARRKLYAACNNARSFAARRSTRAFRILWTLTGRAAATAPASNSNLPEDALAGLDDVLIGLRTRELLQQLVEARCKLSPVLMLIEDLHWTDSAQRSSCSHIRRPNAPDDQHHRQTSTDAQSA